VNQRRSQQPYCQRRIHVDLRVTDDEARFVVRDEGPGFDVASAPNSDDPQTLEQRGGQGLVLMRTFMDEVTFNSTGNEVTLVKRGRPREDAKPAAGGSKAAG
jgi:anti-sigma regulatory factor (Ser/Thr protein kinase)